MAAAKTPKVKAPKPIRLKRQAKPVKIKEGVPEYRVSTGNPNTQSDPIACMKESQARDKAREFFEKQRPWCERFNKAGLDALNQAQAELDSLPVLLTGDVREVRALVDDYSGMTLVARLWKVKV